MGAATWTSVLFCITWVCRINRIDDKGHIPSDQAQPVHRPFLCWATLYVSQKWEILFRHAEFFVLRNPTLNLLNIPVPWIIYCSIAEMIGMAIAPPLPAFIVVVRTVSRTPLATSKYWRWAPAILCSLFSCFTGSFDVDYFNFWTLRNNRFTVLKLLVLCRQSVSKQTAHKDTTKVTAFRMAPKSKLISVG